MKDKYYLITSESSNSSYPRVEINRNHPMYDVLIGEDVERPDFEIIIIKIDTHKLSRPTGANYQKCKEISVNTYEKHFNLVLFNLKNTIWPQAEFYYLQKSSTVFELAMYTTDPKNKFSIIIDIRDSLETTSIDIHKNTNFSYRPSYRNKAKYISDEIFIACFRQTIKYIEDSVSYIVNIESYLSTMKQILESNYEFKYNSDLINLEEVINQLNAKKTQLEKRLMENDADSPVDRATFRGEIEGLKYALNAIKVMRQ